MAEPHTVSAMARETAEIPAAAERLLARSDVFAPIVERIEQAKPRIIVCDTRMGCGVPFLEEREKNHFIRVDAHEWQLALAALEAGRQA